MTDALDRIVPEDKKGTGLYRHDDEGSDDMPVRYHDIPLCIWFWKWKANETNRHTSSRRWWARA